MLIYAIARVLPKWEINNIFHIFIIQVFFHKSKYKSFKILLFAAHHMLQYM